MGLAPQTRRLAITKVVAAFALTILCAADFYGQVSRPYSKQNSEWLLYLKTEGAPWTKKFEVDLNQRGTLVLTETDPQRLPKETTSKLTVNLASKDAQEIYEQAWKTFREFRFAEEDGQRPDGTNLTLRLLRNGRMLEMKFFHFGQAEEESVELAKVLSLINKHLSQEHKIY
jgi:hypothetical protein